MARRGRARQTAGGAHRRLAPGFSVFKIYSFKISPFTHEKLDQNQGLRGNTLRLLRRRGPHHHQPSALPQRLHATHRGRDKRRPAPLPRGCRGTRGGANGRWRQGFLFGRRHARERPRRLRGRRRRAPFERTRRAEADTLAAETRHCHGERLRHWRRPRAAPDVRPHHCLRQRHLRPDGSQGGLVRRRFRRFVPRPHRGTEEGARNMVHVPTVLSRRTRRWHCA